MTETRYGIISDTHQYPEIVPFALNILRDLGVQKLLVNGDIGTGQQYIAQTLNYIGQSSLEAFVQPGSHETLQDYETVVQYFSKKYPNVIDVFKNRKVEFSDHHLVFMPGSDFTCGGQYTLSRVDDLSSGFYNTPEGPARLTNINDLSTLVTHPDKTIVVCHVPRKFDNLETGVDMAEFGETTSDFLLGKQFVKRGSVFPIQVAKNVVQAGYPVLIKKENRGNIDLKEIYRKLGVSKAVSGHFHESVHRACDGKGMHVPAGETHNELFWMASYLDGLKIGILTVKDSRVAYQNISLEEYKT